MADGDGAEHEDESGGARDETAGDAEGDQAFERHFVGHGVGVRVAVVGMGMIEARHLRVLVVDAGKKRRLAGDACGQG